MKPTLPSRPLRRLRPALFAWGFAAIALTSLAAERSTTVIQPPAPPGLPKPPAIRLGNPPGLPTPPSVGDVIRVEKEPPPARDEAVPAQSARPFPEAVWVPGYHVWHGGEYVWVAGKWERPPEGRTVWVAPRWEKRDGGFVFVEGYRK
jgi:hypothetical protein